MKKTLAVTISVFVTAVLTGARPFNDPYQDLKFYYGDNHFHSGFSADNSSDKHPLFAYLTAINRLTEIDHASKPNDEALQDLGGYFLFMSDHIQYVPTRRNMSEEMYQEMKKESDDPRADRTGPHFTFTAFPGGELTGLARTGIMYFPWDDRFGHLNIFNVESILLFAENNLFWNHKGTDAMDLLSRDVNSIGQFDHPGYGSEPRTGNDAKSLYPFTSERDRVFRLFEVTDGNPRNWDVGVAQYQICLQKGFHVSPVVGTDIHNTGDALLFKRQSSNELARTVIMAPSTLGKSLQERREILLESVRAGRVYATENPNLRIKFSVNGFPMGHRFTTRPDRLEIWFSIHDPGSPGALQSDATEIQKIELLQNRICNDHEKPIPDADVRSESQCTRLVRRWSIYTPERAVFLTKDLSYFETSFTTPNTDRDLRYLFLEVTQQNGSRAITSPVYFE